MIDKNFPPLLKTASFLVSENRNSDLDVGKRHDRQKKGRSGRFLHILYKAGFSGLFLYLFVTSLRSFSYSLFRGVVVEDHANSIIRHSLDRVYEIDSRHELTTYKSSVWRQLTVFIKSLSYLREAYKSTGIEHVTEFVRVAKLFNFYVRWRAVFEKSPPSAVLIARTNDQKRLALGLVAEVFQVPLVAYLMDLVAVRKPAPFSVSLYMCWTTFQMESVKKEHTDTAQLPVPFIREMKLPVPKPNKAVCGLLLNAKCDLKGVDKFIDSLYRKFGLNNLFVRPHPGTSEERVAVLNNVFISDWREALHDYFEKLDIVFALNTIAVIDALLHGVPVIYVGGLDPYDYDLQGYVRDGIAYPFSEKEDIFKSADLFYASDFFKKRWTPELFTGSGLSERNALSRIIKSHK